MSKSKCKPTLNILRDGIVAMFQPSSYHYNEVTEKVYRFPERAVAFRPGTKEFVEIVNTEYELNEDELIDKAVQILRSRKNEKR